MEIKIRKRGMPYNIPFEMQVEIMKRLPVKSLAVFRSVSKVWKSMIDSRLFIADYTNYHQHHRLLIRYGVRTFKYVSMVDNDTLSQHEFQIVANVPESVEQLVGTSQGLLCLFGDYLEDGWYKQTAVIWNPSLGKTIAIDVPVVHDSDPTDLGFGVRPDNLDPMVVLINYVEHRYKVMVFTLSSRVWRDPRGKLPPMSIYIESISTVATDDRCIYWKAHDWSINLVVAFDMVSEDFMEINLPHSVAHRSFDDFFISKIKESLALLEYCYDAWKTAYGIWMMEDGASKSFTKLFTINTPNASLRTKVIGFRKNDQPIMETPTDEYRVSSIEFYEPRTRTIKNLGINGELGSFYMSSYTETLLLLDQLDEQFVGSNCSYSL